MIAGLKKAGAGASREAVRREPKVQKIDPDRHHSIEAGEIILALDRPIVSAGLKIARARQDDLPALVVQRVMRFKMADKADTDFLYYCLRDKRFIDFIAHEGMTGSDLPSSRSSERSIWIFFTLFEASSRRKPSSAARRSMTALGTDGAMRAQSRLRAVASFTVSATSSHHSVVLEGPPGTFEDLHSTSFSRKFEREKGFEPSTSTLARWHSTTELLPRVVRDG